MEDVKDTKCNDTTSLGSDCRKNLSDIEAL